MRKSNGGYALPYVLVVMTILSLVAVSVMSNTLTGLQTQKLSTARMQSRHAAEGEIEKVFAQLHGIENVKTTESNTEQGAGSLGQEGNDENAANSRICKAFDAEVLKLLGSNVDFIKSTYNEKVYACELKSNGDGATISCVMNLEVDLEAKEPEPSADYKETIYAYTIKSLEITYSSYVITYN